MSTLSAGEGNVMAAGERRYERFDQKYRVQHVLMVTSFVTCVVTGFPLKYPDWAWMNVIVRAMGGIEVCRVLHRVGAVIMTIDFVWHVIDVLRRYFKAKMRISQIDILPWPKDFVQFFQNIGYYLGITDKRPQFARFSYMEKFDYWAVFWGMFIMVGTGVVMWFPEFFGKFLPTRWIVATMIAHSDEGLLAFLAIAIWHIFNVHLCPARFPMSWVWLDGTMSAEEMHHEHPALYEQIRNQPAPANLGRYPVVKGLLGLFSVGVIGILIYGATRPAKPQPPEGIAHYATRLAKESVKGLGKDSPLYAESFKAARREMFEQFHEYEPPAALPVANRSACLLSGCHTDLAHQRSPEIRAYMNMHGQFMTCETCHYRKDINDISTVGYGWFDHGMKDSPLAKAPPAGTSRDAMGQLVGMGNYVRLIAPYREHEGKREVVFTPASDPRALEYERTRNRLTSEEIARVKARFHENVVADGPACIRCHTVNGQLDYKALGFSSERTKELEMLRVAVFYFLDAEKAGYNVSNAKK
jgi:formate dehydrogenase subunit gamma